MSRVIGRGRYASETYPSAPSNSGGGAGWPFGPFFTRTPPPVAADWTPLNFTRQGSQATAPTFTDVGPSGDGGVLILAPAGVTAWQAQEISIETPADPWTFTLGLTAGFSFGATNTGGPFTGIEVRDPVSGHIFTTGATASKTANGFFAGGAETILSSPTTPIADALFAYITPGAPTLLRAEYDGTNFSVSYSVDGVSWLFSEPPTPIGGIFANLPSNVGFGVWPNTTADVTLLCWSATLTQP